MICQAIDIPTYQPLRYNQTLRADRRFVPGACVLDSSSDLKDLLRRADAGDRSAAEELAPLVYEELRSIAHRCLRRERAGHTLQTTALVHEAYLRLLGQTRVNWQGRRHFLAVAATMMRRILVNHARDRNRLKRGGAMARVELGDAHFIVAANEQVDHLALDEALAQLGELAPEKVQLVELRYFAGCTLQEIAELQQTSLASVKREWALTRAWLRKALRASAAE